jgi:hypothetical protein
MDALWYTSAIATHKSLQQALVVFLPHVSSDHILVLSPHIHPFIEELSVKSQFFLVGLTLVLGSHAVAQMSSANPKPNDTTWVVVAEDRTSEADCKVWIDSPANEQACDPGSVIVARRTTYREVEQNRTADYAVLTGDKQKDVHIERELVAKVTAQLRDQQAQPLACTEG